MPRRGTAIKTYSQDAEGTVLVLDAGNALSGQTVARLSQGEVVVEGMNAMGYDAMGLGYNDTMIGLDALRQRVEQADFAIVSANLAWTESGELLFDPYTIIERDGLRFGILGLSASNADSGPGLLDKTIVTDATVAAAKYVAELQPQVDAIIVLSLLGTQADVELAEAVPGIHVIVGGNSGQLMMQPLRSGNTLVVQQGYNGEWMGKLTATFDQAGVPSDYSETLITLSPDFADDPELAAIKERYELLYAESPTAD